VGAAAIKPQEKLLVENAVVDATITKLRILVTTGGTIKGATTSTTIITSQENRGTHIRSRCS